MNAQQSCHSDLLDEGSSLQLLELSTIHCATTSLTLLILFAFLVLSCFVLYTLAAVNVTVWWHGDDVGGGCETSN